MSQVHAGENTSDPPPPPSLRQQQSPCPALLSRWFVSVVELAIFWKEASFCADDLQNMPVQVLVAVTTPNKIISTNVYGDCTRRVIMFLCISHLTTLEQILF